MTAFIVHVGWEVTGEVVRHLMDGVDPDVLDAAEAAVVGLKAISHVHVRARWAGRCLIVEIEGFVPPATTVEDGEAMRQEVILAVLAAVPQARAVQWYPRAAPSPCSD